MSCRRPRVTHGRQRVSAVPGGGRWLLTCQQRCFPLLQHRILLGRRDPSVIIESRIVESGAGRSRDGPLLGALGIQEEFEGLDDEAVVVELGQP
ncbi:hypothetical protein GCM10027452_09520 [Micromonospora halotolerans]